MTVSDPNSALLTTLFDVARKASQANDSEKVIEACESAYKVSPRDARFMFLHGVALRRKGDLRAAAEKLRMTIQEVPGLGVAHREYGLACLGLDRIADARKALEWAVKIDPKDYAAWRALCEARMAEGDDAGAAEAYRNGLGSSDTDPKLLEAMALFSKGRIGKSEALVREFLQQNPLDVNAIRLLADIGTRLGMLDDTIKLLERCLELAPDFHVARSNYAKALGQKQRYPEALQEIGKLTEAEPDNIGYALQQASLLSMAGIYEQAHDKFREVLKKVPENAKILTSFGHSLRFGGKGSDAIDVYQDAIEKDPANGEPYWSLANLKTFRFSDERIEDMWSRLRSAEEPNDDTFHLAFALGKALEDSKNYADSFGAYAIGNQIKRQFSSYKSSDVTERVDGAIEHLSAKTFEVEGHPSNEAIFVVGLPRAGSTLLEQILASHSEVEATDELPFIGQMASRLSGKRKRGDKTEYPAIINDLTAEQRQELGQTYLDRAAVYRTGAPRFIDKLPNNFLHVGLIKAIMPNATIVDARREPMAACFANFKQLFARGQEFTYSLEDIGRYYADYVRLIDHWNAILPGQVLTVQYENVVDDLETQVRTLLDHCDLSFEEACVQFHEQDRAVRTASSEQVRQPIYKDAVALWKHYEEYLEPLKKVLSDAGLLT